MSNCQTIKFARSRGHNMTTMTQ